MRILIADDDSISRRMLKETLSKWGYEVVVAMDGTQAWALLQEKEAPNIAILDWMMPGMNGVEICRKVRAMEGAQPTYIILLTAGTRREDLVAAPEAGADDFVTKPWNPQELRARVKVGIRVVDLQKSLADRIQELEDVVSRVKMLGGLLPICSYCKKIRDDRNYWQQLETYVAEHTEARFSHGICPDCYEAIFRMEFGELHDHREKPA